MTVTCPHRGFLADRIQGIRELRQAGHSFKEIINMAKQFFCERPLLDELYYWLNRDLLGLRWIVREVEKSKMLLDLSASGIHKDLFLYGIREAESTLVFKNILSKGMKVVDIGANIGYYALMEARIVGHTGVVYAIEPSPRNFAVLKKNVEINGYSNVELHQIAIGHRNGPIKMRLAGDPNQDRISTVGSDVTVEVEMMTLDNFLGSKPVDVIRMDVEGFECRIFEGMENTLKKNMPDLFIELHSDSNLKEYGGSRAGLLSEMANLGYEISHVGYFNSRCSSIKGCIRRYIENHISKKRPIPDLKVVECNSSIDKVFNDPKLGRCLSEKGCHLFLSGGVSTVNKAKDVQEVVRP